MPDGQWTVYINGENAGTTPLDTAEGSVTVEPISAMVLVKDSASTQQQDNNATQGPDENNVLINPILSRIVMGILIAAAIVTVILVIKKIKK